MIVLQSLVENFEGECSPTWLNGNKIYIRIDTRITGFFKIVKRGWLGIRYKSGKKFHGYIGSDGKVRSTVGIYSSSQFV